MPFKDIKPNALWINIMILSKIDNYFFQLTGIRSAVNVSFVIEMNGILFNSRTKDKLSVRSYSI